MDRQNCQYYSIFLQQENYISDLGRGPPFLEKSCLFVFSLNKTGFQSHFHFNPPSAITPNLTFTYWSLKKVYKCVLYYSSGGGVPARAEGDFPGAAFLPVGQRVLAPDAGALLLDIRPCLQSQTGWTHVHRKRRNWI